MCKSNSNLFTLLNGTKSVKVTQPSYLQQLTRRADTLRLFLRKFKQYKNCKFGFLATEGSQWSDFKLPSNLGMLTRVFRSQGRLASSVLFPKPNFQVSSDFFSCHLKSGFEVDIDIDNLNRKDFNQSTEVELRNIHVFVGAKLWSTKTLMINRILLILNLSSIPIQN